MTALTLPVLDPVAASKHRGLPDFVILHKGACGCRSGGYVRDAFYAQEECLECRISKITNEISGARA